MTWSKRNVIEQAFSEIGKGHYEFDLEPDVLQSALRQLDAMMATWSGTLGAKVNFSGGDGFGEISQKAGVPDWAVEALYLNLAIRLAPSFGKMVSPQTIASARQAYDGLVLRTIKPTPRVLTGYAGGGSRRSAIPVPIDDLVTATNNPLEFG